MSIRILIADDNAAVRTALRELLKSEGWEVIEAANGKEAVARAQETKPQLIILDLAMPSMDGLTASREITKQFPDTPIIMHTLYSSPQVEMEGRKVGVRKTVAKSESSDLLSAVRELLQPEPSVTPQTPSEPVPANGPSPVVMAGLHSATPVTNPAAGNGQPKDPTPVPPPGSGDVSR
jgi:two-component system, chemotaxis family, chemotaxis protein CheY